MLTSPSLISFVNSGPSSVEGKVDCAGATEVLVSIKKSLLQCPQQCTHTRRQSRICHGYSVPKVSLDPVAHSAVVGDGPHAPPIHHNRRSSDDRLQDHTTSCKGPLLL